MKPILLLVLLLSVPGLGIQPSLAADEWLKDEVLKELAELRREVFQLKQEIVVLKGKDHGGAGQTTGSSLAEFVGNRPAIGSDSAGLIMLVFSDFECPFCRKFSQDILPVLKKNYVDTGKVRLVMRDFPLGFHGAARSASLAARCAGLAGKYWEMQQFLFNHQSELNDRVYGEGAAGLGLDVPQFRKCMNDRRVDADIDQDVAIGERYGIRGTPGFLIGRVDGNQVSDIQPASGAMSPEAFARILDPRLRTSKKQQ